MKQKKRARRLKPPLLNVARTMGKWLPHDDFLLIQSVLQLSDLKAVYQCTKFSVKFTLKEIQERWYAILYDAPISRMIYDKLQTIPNEDIEKLKEQAPFTDTENEVLTKISSTNRPSLSELNEILATNRNIFHESRSVECLKKQWSLLKHFNLLNDQCDKAVKSTTAIAVNQNTNSSSNTSGSDLNMSFEEKEKLLNDTEIMENVNLNEDVEEEMSRNYKRLMEQIKKAETELFLWQVLAEHVTNKANAFENVECLALLKCENYEYIMKSRDIAFGRSTDTQSVDLDFTQIGMANKISRNHGSIKMTDNCTFYIYNNSNKPIFVDGKILLKSCKTQLFDKSIIQIGDFSLLFFINFNIMTPQQRSLQTKSK